MTTKEDTNAIHEISLLSGVDETDVRKVFESFLTQFVFKYTKNKRVHIPFIGNFLVRYREDVETESGREAQLDAFYAPHDQMRRLVGQLKDAEESGNYTEIDVFKNLKKLIKTDFKTTLED